MTATVTAITPAARREIVLDCAKKLVLAESFGPPLLMIAATLEPLGIDILSDPLHMASLSVLADCARYGLRPSQNALLHLGCEATS